MHIFMFCSPNAQIFADKVAQLIIESQFQSNDDELDTMILSLKKLDL